MPRSTSNKIQRDKELDISLTFDMIIEKQNESIKKAAK